MPDASLPRFRNMVDGRHVDAVGGDWFESYDPFIAKRWSLIPRCGEADVDTAVNTAHQAFSSGPWGQMKPTQRGKLSDVLQPFRRKTLNGWRSSGCATMAG